jgi:NAD(P)-dependent dehydrogenase (short-subunit alcohol dehydrogenase family)
MSELRFDGRVAIVTGAGGNPGLGRSYAMLLASRGARVVVNDLGVGPDGRGAIGGGPDQVVAEIRAAGGEAIASTESVAERDSAARVVAAAISQWGRVDILVNNAGIAPFALFDEISDTDIERVIGVHLMGHIWMCRAAWGHMARQGYGRLVNVSSGVSLIGLPNQPIYSGAKLGIVGLTRALAAGGLNLGIKANVIMPAADTLAWRTMLEPAFSEQSRRAGIVPDVVAPVTAWLAHESCPVSGKILETSAGAVSEVFFARTKGTAPDPDLSPELVDSRIGQILDRADPTVFADPDGVLPPSMVTKAYVTDPR